VIGLDTNVLARYYVDDASDAEAQAQRQAARRLIEAGQPLMVSKSVVLELEWVLRGYYQFPSADVISVLQHLLAQRHVTVEDRSAVEQALANTAEGIDFADALHHASYRGCDSVATFDDRRFARRSRRLGMVPIVKVVA
jgi:predicted nucleic-acid-binding protein